MIRIAEEDSKMNMISNFSSN